MSKPLLKVNNLKKHFPIHGGIIGTTLGHVKAVSDVDIEVNQEETLGIVGESGYATHTAARILLTRLEQTEGKLQFNEKNVNPVSPIEMRKMRPDIQMLFQDPYASLNPRHT